MMDVYIYKAKITFLTPVLGSQPAERDIASAFIAKKAGLDSLPEDEDQYLPEMIDKGTTRFYRMGKDSEIPAMMNYQMLGFLKESGSVQNGKVSGKVKNLRSKVAKNIFVSPRIFPLNLPDTAEKEMDYLERPLRADNGRVQNVALARSEMLPEGTWFECNIEVLKGSDVTEEVLREILDYGYYRGLGQWRSSGSYGTFIYELRNESEYD